MKVKGQQNKFIFPYAYKRTASSYLLLDKSPRIFAQFGIFLNFSLPLYAFLKCLIKATGHEYIYRAPINVLKIYTL